MNRSANLKTFRWQLTPPIPAELSRSLQHINPIMRQILFTRGLTSETEIAAFLEGRYFKMADPFLLAGMDKAVERIERAIKDDERIVVYGDFDADGVTSTVLLVEALRGFGLSRSQAQPYIPDRVDEGYGLNMGALSSLKEKGADLVISVDCGIRALAEVQHAREIGLDIIITDHHTVGEVLPEAVAVINPKRKDGSYPERMLAGVGVAYKLVQALKETLPAQTSFDERSLLDLVAIGTIADLAPLTGENRSLVRDGLQVANEGLRPGVAALAEIAGEKLGSITAESVSFGLGPRINAAGRMESAYAAARLLASDNILRARDLARELDRLNQRRRDMTLEQTALAEELVDPGRNLLFAADGRFHPGLVGLIASGLARHYNRPAIVLDKGDETSRASCRSIEQIHIMRALDEVSDLLVRYGGHSQAAGFTVRNEKLEELHERLDEIISAKLAGKDLQPTLNIDAEAPIDSLDWSLQALLEQLEPTGAANRRPLFLSRNVKVESHRGVGKDGAHLQLSLSGDSNSVKAIAFRQGQWSDTLPERIDLVYALKVNHWNGRRELQLMVEDIRPADMAAG